MDNPEKLAAKCTQDEDKQNKNTMPYMLDTINLYTIKHNY